ncbi:DUF3008 family protein [Arboricoccus pini]|uniref:DUF3008 family protein n=1 Tax=Arboricoccus pini TaxID=1963835 RepID=UPI000D088E2E|nr:DUF3008 family protein [Arboricoccus pini]
MPARSRAQHEAAGGATKTSRLKGASKSMVRSTNEKALANRASAMRAARSEYAVRKD